MSKQDLVSTLNALEDLVRQLSTRIRKASLKFIDNREIQELARQVGTKWFEDISLNLERFPIAEEIRRKYDEAFTKLLSLSLKGSHTSTYLRLLDQITGDLAQDVIVSVLKSPGQIVATAHLAKILENTKGEEKNYLMEALGCASYSYLRASVILAWSAAIHRMHTFVEKIGFEEFNKKTGEMKNTTKGRFKGFNKTYSIHSVSELRASVFDSDLLWVLEYMEAIDKNQHDRLANCLTMRNNAAHPGEAVISEPNLVSFYSDLKIMVFDNPKLRV